jgi:hypothetical protein
VVKESVAKRRRQLRHVDPVSFEDHRARTCVDSRNLIFFNLTSPKSNFFHFDIC